MHVHSANKDACRCARIMRQCSPLPCFRCADLRNARGFVALRNAIAPNWAESDYFAPSNAIVHDALVLHTPICGFSRDGGKSSLNRGMFALCLQFEYLQWQCAQMAKRAESTVVAHLYPRRFAIRRQSRALITSLPCSSPLSTISVCILAEFENWKLRQADYGV